LVLGALLTLGACKRVEPEYGTPHGGLDNLVVQAPGKHLPLLERIVAAAQTQPYCGTRVFERTSQLDSRLPDYEFRELVGSDGQGRFLVDLTDVISPVLAPDREELVKFLQNNTQGLVFRFRDFAIRRLDLFLRNYAVIDLGRSPTVADRPCQEFEFVRLGADEPRFRVAVDDETAILLRVIETDAAGHEVGRVAFETFDTDLDALPPDLRWHQSRIGEEAVTPERAAEKFGQEVRLPRWVPQGYQLAALDVVELFDNPKQASQRWLRATYDDGALPLFVLQGPPRDAFGGAAGTPQQLSLQADRVTHWERAPWILLEGSIEGRDLMLVGRLGLSEAHHVLDSAR
jgi:negative regulator of sigma E activity